MGFPVFRYRLAAFTIAGILAYLAVVTWRGEKRMRAAGFEPVNVLSGYRWQGGLGYYESTKDLATNFFIDYLPKGVYVFEYAVMVQHKGKYPTGLASIQCMYAPEFNAHSGSAWVEAE